MPIQKTTIWMQKLLVGSVLMGVGVGAPMAQDRSQPAPGEGTEVRAVLELFTSQGCSSCPPADALLETYANRKDVIALSLPVDYWDYLGWKDTLASPKFSARQKYYAKERGDGRVYTPQMVVSGLAHVVGSSTASIDTAIAATEAQFKAARVPVNVRVDGKRLVIETGDAPVGARTREATIWMAMVDRASLVKIERGENRGKTVKYVNVVRDLSPIGTWSGKAATIAIDRAAVSEPGNEMCVVLLQVGKAGPIVGAAMTGGL